MVQVDLHLHTTYSDGTLSPSELVRLCASRGLKVIAITDHDSTEGVPEALEAAEYLDGLTLIPGIELSADVPGSEVHLLGYFVQYQDPELQRALRRLRVGREQRAREVLEKLNGLGVHISWRRVQELSDGGAIGRPHIAQAMVEGGYVRYPREAFDRYLGRTGPAYVERENYTPVMAVEMLVRNGALPAMAHPFYSMASTDADGVAGLKRMLSELKEAGLVGVEVYYAEHSHEQVELLAAVADAVGLVPCGGSDYHCSGNPGEHEPGSAGPPMETVETLRSLRRRRAATSR
jgi:predicted metal-dependent phosphoesterase TrpH